MLTLFTAWFFRNPARTIPQGAGLVVAPGDGKVIAIEEEFDPRYLKDRSLRVTIFLNVFDVHINRMPCEGTIEDVQYQPGLFLVASKPEATLRNEQNALMIYKFLQGVVEQRLSPKSIDGPIGIAVQSGRAAKQGTVPYLMLMAAVSLNLAVVNLAGVPSIVHALFGVGAFVLFANSQPSSEWSGRYADQIQEKLDQLLPH